VLDEADRLLAGGGGFDKQVCIPEPCPLSLAETPIPLPDFFFF